MSHSADHVETTPEQRLSAPERTAAAARQALGAEAAIELSNPKGAAPPGADARQALLLTQQGLKDLTAGDQAKGILQLMQASIANPQLVRDQQFIGVLHQAAPEVSSDHNHAAAQAVEAGLAQAPQQVSTGDAAQGGSRPDVQGQATPGQAGDGHLEQQGTQLAQQGLAEITAGNGAGGILKLMSAAQLDPSILQDSRFAAALQTALASAKGNATTATQPHH